jgi:hypothetical protein
LTCRPAWSASTCRSRWRTTPSAAGERPCFGPTRCTSTRTMVTARWPDPATSTVDLGFPRTR